MRFYRKWLPLRLYTMVHGRKKTWGRSKALLLSVCMRVPYCSVLRGHVIKCALIFHRFLFFLPSVRLISREKPFRHTISIVCDITSQSVYDCMTDPPPAWHLNPVNQSTPSSRLVTPTLGCHTFFKMALNGFSARHLVVK